MAITCQRCVKSEESKTQNGPEAWAKRESSTGVQSPKSSFTDVFFLHCPNFNPSFESTSFAEQAVSIWMLSGFDHENNFCQKYFAALGIHPNEFSFFLR